MFVVFVSLILNLYFFAIPFLILNKYLLSYPILYSSYKRANKKLYKLQALQNLDPPLVYSYTYTPLKAFVLFSPCYLVLNSLRMATSRNM